MKKRRKFSRKFFIDEETSVTMESGVRIITENTLKRQAKQDQRAMEIPTKNEVVAIGRTVRSLTPDWCKNGDIEHCPAPCGACLYEPKAGSRKVRKAKVIEVLDEFAYLGQPNKIRLGIC